MSDPQTDHLIGRTPDSSSDDRGIPGWLKTGAMVGIFVSVYALANTRHEASIAQQQPSFGMDDSKGKLFGDGQVDYGGRRHSRTRRRRLVDHCSVRPLRRAHGIQFALQGNGLQPAHRIRVIHTDQARHHVRRFAPHQPTPAHPRAAKRLPRLASDFGSARYRRTHPESSHSRLHPPANPARNNSIRETRNEFPSSDGICNCRCPRLNTTCACCETFINNPAGGRLPDHGIDRLLAVHAVRHPQDQPARTQFAARVRNIFFPPGSACLLRARGWQCAWR